MTIPALSVETAAALGEQYDAPEQLRTSNISVQVLHSPALGAALLRFLNVFLTESALDKRTRELIILRLAWKTRSTYVFGRHRAAAKGCMSEAEMLGVRDPVQCAAYSALDLALLKAVDELLDDAVISDATSNTLEQHYSPRQIVEIVFAVGNWRIFATLSNTARIPLEPGFEGWPEGKSPAEFRN